MRAFSPFQIAGHDRHTQSMTDALTPEPAHRSMAACIALPGWLGFSVCRSGPIRMRPLN
jgi:hypothetical protein